MLAIWNFIVAHQAVVASMGVAIIDLAIALNQSLAANGLIHAALLFLQGKSQIASS